jgi:hypothetical protein
MSRDGEWNQACADRIALEDSLEITSHKRVAALGILLDHAKEILEAQGLAINCQIEW